MGQPSITLSKSTGLDADGDTIHVTGSNFGPNENGKYPPVAGHPAGFYVAFGKYAEPWKPSAGAPSSNRVNGEGGAGLWWVVPQETYDFVAETYGPDGTEPNPGLFAQYVVLKADGSFELDLTVAKAQGDITKSTPGTYGVYTYGAAGATGAAFETATPISFGTTTPPTSKTTGSTTTTATMTKTPTSSPKVTIKGGTSVTAGDKIVINGTGFAAGEKVTATAHSTPVTIGTVRANAAGAVQFAWTVPADFPAGKHTVTLAATSGTTALTFTVKAAATSPTSSTPVVQCTTETVPATPGTPSLNWGVKSAFDAYVTSNIAKGSISTAGGAARAGESFTWGSGSGSLNSSGVGTVNFPGSVHFTGHDGVLNVTISNVRIKTTGSNSGVLIADVASTDMQGNDVSGSGITFANLSFSSLGATGGSASTTLTAAGAKAFAGFYSAGEALDSVTLSITGAKSATTVQRCTDAAGNPVDSNGSPVAGLAETGFSTASMTGLAAALMAAGALMLAAMRRRGTAMPRH